MPFAYTVAAQAGATNYTTHATPATEDPVIVMRQTTKGFTLTGFLLNGRAAAATTISGISAYVRRWTTAGSGGTAVNVAPTRIGPTATTACVDKASAITAGTVSGAIQATASCGKAGPGGWAARDGDHEVHVEGGSSDELDLDTVAGEASLPFFASCTITE